MEARDWVALASIISTLCIAVVTLLINQRREQRQEALRREERDREHQLKLKEKESELRFGKLHEKRVGVLSELYERLESLKFSTELFVLKASVEERSTEYGSAEPLAKEFLDCQTFCSRNRLYFSKDLVRRIDDVLELSSLALEASTYLANPTPESLNRLRQATEKWKMNVRKVDDALESIEREFRAILGV